MSEINANTTTAEVKDMNLLSRIIGVFVSPSATFNAIAAKPNWIIPTIIILLLSLGTTILLKPVIVAEQKDKVIQQLDKQGAEGEQREKALETSEKTMKIAMYPSALIGTIIMLLITAGIWLFFGNIMMGGKANFVQMLGVVVYRTFIPVVGGLIKAPLMISQNTLNIHFSLATFMADSSKDTFLYKFLAQIELFNIWAIIALAIGIAIVGKLPVKKVWPWVAIIYVLWFLASAALSGLIGR